MKTQSTNYHEEKQKTDTSKQQCRNILKQAKQNTRKRFGEDIPEAKRTGQ